tara:strand:+ start:36 stop:251 length:216 start_codon:yes stop_codon:yes gene_type:complete
MSDGIGDIKDLSKLSEYDRDLYDSVYNATLQLILLEGADGGVELEDKDTLEVISSALLDLSKNIKNIANNE